MKEEIEKAHFLSKDVIIKEIKMFLEHFNFKKSKGCYKQPLFSFINSIRNIIFF